MSTEKQRDAARRNIRKAQAKWQSMSTRERSKAQAKGRERTRPGRTGEGDFYHVGVRDKAQFETFRTHDVGDEGGIERVAGQRENGSWDTVKWLISKKLAHVDEGRLVPDHEDAKNVLEQLGSKPRHIEGDFFTASPRPNVPEKDKPTPAQQRSRKENIEKARQARRAKD